MARLSCGIKVTRITLFILNVIFLVFGLVLFGFGIYLAASKKFDVAFLEDVKVQIIGGKAIQDIGIVLICVGFLTVILFAIGGAGALKENRILLYIYAGIICVLMIIELGAFIAAMVLRTELRDTYEKNLWTIFKDAYEMNKTDVQQAVEKLESKFECCGVYDSDDYPSINATTPSSCYKTPGAPESLYDKGCGTAILDWILDELPLIAGVTVAVIILQIFGLIASIAMGVAISHSSYGEILTRQ